MISVLPFISVAIQTHPLREALSDALSARLPAAEVVVDPDPLGRRSPWRTYRHALELTPPDATHRLILQDDTEICDGFADAVQAAITAQPDRVVAFFIAGNPPQHRFGVYAACQADHVWVDLPNTPWMSAVATCWPARLVHEIGPFYDSSGWPDTFTADDEILGRFLRHIGERPLATVPSLVQHPDMAESLIRRRDTFGQDPGRVAACWIGDCTVCDASKIDWTGPVHQRM